MQADGFEIQSMLGGWVTFIGVVLNPGPSLRRFAAERRTRKVGEAFLCRHARKCQ
jgi:hypothetical protein